jgi:hypothetical protein
VYVEETSFRSKSIEGVGTSTTGFAGPTRTGPLGQTPELLTSFADFERMYGGLDNLSFGVNYLAHAVRAYFNEGGARLYVSRVFAGDASARARAEVASTGGGAPKKAAFVARFPGAAGGGDLTLRLDGTPVTLRAMKAAPDGTLLRTGTGGDPARPALATSSLNAPFALPNNGKLMLTVGAAEKEITVKGEAALVESDDALPDTVNVAQGDTELAVVIDGVAQRVALPAGDQPRAALADAINRELRGGFARLSEANRLQIGSDRRGSQASVRVSKNDSLKFAAQKTDANAADANNNVANLANVSPQEINALLIGENVDVRLLLLPNGQVLLSTLAAGSDARLQIRSGAGSIEGALGFAATPQPLVGAAGTAIKYYVKSGNNWLDASDQALPLAGLADDQAPDGGAEIVSLSVTTTDSDGNATAFDGLALDKRHPRYIGNVLAQTPSRRADALFNRFAFVDEGVGAFGIIGALFAGASEVTLRATGGDDGAAPQPSDYEAALRHFEGLEDISIVAAPGATAYGDATNVHAYANVVTSHAETRRLYRIAVLDSPLGETTVGGVREFRGKLIDSTRAALYFPWVVVANPSFRTGADNVPRELALPPSGFVAGIYARNDVNRGVYKAPANEPVRGALRFAADINTAQQDVLNPLGVNCLRFLSGRGYRVWGARTVSSDPEWKYVNVRRYFNYMEASIDRGTQWAVFEPNGERLWSNVRATIEGFLYNEWVNGALLGTSPQEAFFVRCDRSTMTQNDLDNGRLVCLIGVAALKPAEFVIFRIGQKTADARS